MPARLIIAASLLALTAVPVALNLAALRAQPAANCDVKALNDQFERAVFPDFVGCSVEEALEFLRARTSYPVTEELSPSNDFPRGIVLAQYPAAGVPLGYVEDGVRLTVSSGPASQAATTYRIADAQAAEGQRLSFRIERSRAGDAPTDLTVVTSGGGTAVVGVDYETVSRSVTFAPKELSATFDVSTNPNAEAKANRTIQVLLVAGPLESPLTLATATGTIIDTPDAEPLSLSASAASVTEGEEMIFRVNREGDRRGQLSLTWRAIDDFGRTLASGPLDFASGQAQASASVATVDDEIDDLERTVTVIVTETRDGTSREVARGSADIIDNDAAPRDWWLILAALAALVPLAWALIRYIWPVLKDLLWPPPPVTMSCALTYDPPRLRRLNTGAPGFGLNVRTALRVGSVRLSRMEPVTAEGPS